jgi:hypothetical protein
VAPLTGTPVVGSAGTYPFAVVATDALNAQSAPYNCSLLINPAPAGPVTITTTSPLPSGQLTVSYSGSLSATGGVPPYTFAQCSGTALATQTGISFNADGTLGPNVPTTQGTFNFGARATDSVSTASSCQPFQLTIAAAPSCGATPGPPTYPCTRTDLANAAPPLPIPNVGGRTGFNTIVTPTFGSNTNRVVRITDTQAILPNHNTSFWMNCGGSSDDMIFNTDNSLVLVQDEGCNTYPLAFNTATMQVSKLYPALFPGSAYKFPFNSYFSRSNRNLLYEANGVTIEKRDYTDWLSGPKTTPPTPVTVFDFTTPFNGQHNCLAAGFVSFSTSVGGSTSNDTMVMTYSTTGGQGTAGMVYVVAYVPGKGCAMWRTDTGAVTTDPGFVGGAGLSCTSNGCTGTIATPDRFTVHNAKVGADNNWALVTGTICNTAPCVSGFPDAPYFWQIGTTTVGWCAQGGRCSGHAAIGNNHYFNDPGTNHIWQDAIRVLGFNSASTLVIPLANFPVMPNALAGQGITDAHYAWHNADAADTYPVFWTSYAHPSGVVANNWAQINTPVGATQIRDFEINRRTGCFYVVDRLSGFWASCDKGATWTQRNTGLASTTAWTITYDPVRDRIIYGTLSGGGQNVLFYSSTDDGQHWTLITLPSTSASGWSAYTGGTIAPNGDEIIGLTHGLAGTGGTAYSSNGTTFTQSVVPANGTCTAPGGAWGLFNDPINSNVWLGTEQCGVYKSTDNAHTFAPCSAVSNPPSSRTGNAESFAVSKLGAIYFAAQGGLYKSAAGACPLTFSVIFGNSNTSEGRSVYIDASGTLWYGHKKDVNAPVCPPSCTNPTNAGTTTVYQSLDGGTTWAPFSTGLPTQLEAWRFIENPFDHQMYVYLQNGAAGNAGSIYATVQGAGTLAPYGWQNEVMAVSPTGSGTNWRFTPTFNTTMSQLFQTSIASGTVSQDGKFFIFNSDWYGQLGSENGNANCLLGTNCRGDVFVVELK